MQSTLYSQYKSDMQKELIKLFHESDFPLHFNKTGNKEFTNYQRISLIVIFRRENKPIRDFIDWLGESKWFSWLGLRKIPKKSTFHDWLNLFDMQKVRSLHSKLLPEKVKLTSIDGTGFDAWQRSRHYEKRAEEIKPLPYMPYAKAGIFIDVKTQIILDYEFEMSHKHDVKMAEKIFKRNKIKNIMGLGDKGYDSENLHEIARTNGIVFYAPVRERDKRSLKQKPKGKYRRKCVELPEFYRMRWINETVNSVLKRTQISALKSKKCFMKQREFGWHVILYNIRRKLIVENNQQSKKYTQTFFCLIVIICPFRTEQQNKNI